jgi:hypothetical protein
MDIRKASPQERVFALEAIEYSRSRLSIIQCDTNPSEFWQRSPEGVEMFIAKGLDEELLA